MLRRLCYCIRTVGRGRGSKVNAEHRLSASTFHVPSALNRHRRLDLYSIDVSLLLMAGGTGLPPGSTSASSSSQSQQSAGQSVACLACREAKQKCTKGSPWYDADVAARAIGSDC